MPPSGLCGGLSTPSRAAAWASRVRRACVHAYSRAAGALANSRVCPLAAAFPFSAQCACVHVRRGLSAQFAYAGGAAVWRADWPPGRRVAAFVLQRQTCQRTEGR